MKIWSEVAIIAAVISFITGVISRAIIKPIWGVPARSFILFSAMCLLIAITLILLAMLNIQEKK